MDPGGNLNLQLGSIRSYQVKPGTTSRVVSFKHKCLRIGEQDKCKLECISGFTVWNVRYVTLKVINGCTIHGVTRFQSPDTYLGTLM